MGTHEVLEHTADVGVRATAATVTDLFVEATLGLLEITGTRAPGSGTETVEIEIEAAPDLGALLVDWLGEVLYLQDARDQMISEIELDSVDASGLKGRVTVSARTGSIEGTPVKAITFHQLVVEQSDGVWNAQVFFDI